MILVPCLYLVFSLMCQCGCECVISVRVSGVDAAASDNTVEGEGSILMKFHCYVLYSCCYICMMSADHREHLRTS